MCVCELSSLVAVRPQRQGGCAPREPRPLFMGMDEHGLHVYFVFGLMKCASFSTCGGTTTEGSARAAQLVC